MDEYTDKEKKDPVEKQRWNPNWVQDDDGMWSLLSYHARVVPSEMQAVRNALWDSEITCNTEPGNKIVISQHSIAEFEKQFPKCANRGVER